MLATVNHPTARPAPSACSAWRVAIGLGLALVALPACDGLFHDGPREPLVFESEIVGLDIVPNPAVVGDTVTITATSEPSFSNYSWRFSDGSSSTTGSTVQWVAPDVPGVYEHRVSLYNGGEPVADSTFSVRVISAP